MSVKQLFVSSIWRLYKKSIKINQSNEDDTVIYACLHQDMIAALLHVVNRKPALLISKSRDGDLLQSALGSDGFQFVRGSSGKSGSIAVRKLVDLLRGGTSIGIAVDGPKGPFGNIQEGVFSVSKIAGIKIVPLTVDYDKKISLSNWDKTAIPLPLSSIKVIAGQPICGSDSIIAERLLTSALLGQ